MEILHRLKALFPIVRASEMDSKDIPADTLQTSIHGSIPVDVQVTGTPSNQDPRQKEPADLTIRPDVYSDILIEGDPQYEFFPEREFVRYQPKFLRRLMMLEGREEFTRLNCEKKLYDILMKGKDLLKKGIFFLSFYHGFCQWFT